MFRLTDNLSFALTFSSIVSSCQWFRWSVPYLNTSFSRQTHFQSLYLLSPELCLLAGLLAVRTIAVILKHTPTRARRRCVRENQKDRKEKDTFKVLSESESGGLYLLSSESRFDLLTLIEVLQADLPQSWQVLLRRKREMLHTVC